MYNNRLSHGPDYSKNLIVVFVCVCKRDLPCRRLASDTITDEKELHCAIDHMKRNGQLRIVAIYCHVQFSQRYTNSF